MNLKRIYGAGLLGAMIMALIMFVARVMNITTMNLELTIGSMVTQQINARTWWLGLLIHMMAGVLFATAYGIGFELVSRKAGTWIGFQYSLIHVLFSGFVLGWISKSHPLISMPGSIDFNALSDPGFFAINYGSVTTMIFIAIHMIFGVLIGRLYGPIRRCLPRCEDHGKIKEKQFNRFSPKKIRK